MDISKLIKMRKAQGFPELLFSFPYKHLDWAHDFFEATYCNETSHKQNHESSLPPAHTLGVDVSHPSIPVEVIELGTVLKSLQNQ